MLKHVVMWKFKPFAQGKSRMENALWMKENLEGLIGVVPQIKSLQVGINQKESEMAYDAVLILEVEDFEQLALYKNHPAHQRISTYCKAVRESRTVVDFEE